MSPQKIILLLINKFPKLFRRVSFDIFAILNYLFFFTFLPLNIILFLVIKKKILKNQNIKKIIIRNDNLGDCILTLPFLYGSFQKNENNYYISPILKKITEELNINCKWKSQLNIPKNQDCIISNLSTSKISSFSEYFSSYSNKIIFTQFNTDIFSKRGIPIIFHPKYNINKSQTLFISNCFKKLHINSDPIKGIKIINSNIEKYIKKRTNYLVIFLGYGIDEGRKINQYIFNNIIEIAKNRSLDPIILEEPGFEKNIQKIAKYHNIKTKSCKTYLELFIFFKESKYAIGYDCGPMHLASILTNSIMLFSHTPINFFGKHIWNELISSKKLITNNYKIKIIKQLNLATFKKNWIICQDERGCPLHKKVCRNNKCSELNNSILKEAIELIIK